MGTGGPGVQLGVILLTVLGLWVGARLLVDAAVRLARRAGLSELVIGLTVVSLGTSTPELAVTLDAAVKGLGDIGVANVLGSNVYNLAFVLGVVALVRTVPVAQSLVRRDGAALLASTAVGGLALLDLTVTRLEGAALAALFAGYTAYLIRAGRAESAGRRPGAIARPTGLPDAERHGVRDVGVLVAGLVVVLVSGDVLIGAASALARGAGISEWAIGGTIVAAGTSTPEFAVSLVAVRRGSLGVSVGNVVGSNVFNLVGIVGLAALVRPLTVSPAALETLAWLAVVSVAMVAALWTDAVLSRVEGAAFAASELVRWALGLAGLVG